MAKEVLAAASYEKQKYYIMPEFKALPDEVKEEIKILCVLAAQKLTCTFVIGFQEEGDIYFETVCAQDQFDFDEIGAGLEINQIKRKHKELLKALQLWYVIFKTKEGKETTENLWKKEIVE